MSRWVLDATTGFFVARIVVLLRCLIAHQAAPIAFWGLIELLYGDQR